MTVAFCYARFSPRPNAEECDSIEKQIDRCYEYTRRKEYSVYDIYTDHAVSGGELNRDGLQKALDAIKMHPDGDNVLVVDTNDRLARDVGVYVAIKKLVEQAGARIEYADGSPTTETPEGELLIGIMACFAQYERARIRLRTSRGIKKRQEGGKWHGKVPIGYQMGCDGHLIACLPEQQAVNRAKALSKCDWSSGDITMDIQRVYGNFRGNPWSARTVRKMIKKTHTWEVEEELLEEDCLEALENEKDIPGEES